MRPSPTSPQACGPESGPSTSMPSRAQLRDVALRGRVLPHLPVHRRHDQQRTIARDAQRRQQIVGHAVRELGEEVGRGGRDHDRVGFTRQIDVRHVVRHAPVPLAGVDRTAGQRLHRDGGDELRGRFGHHDLHGRAGLGQQAREFGDLVAGDAARHAEDEMFSCEFCGCQRKPPTKRGGGRGAARRDARRHRPVRVTAVDVSLSASRARAAVRRARAAPRRW